jgi:hypothetical protein
MKAKVWDRWKAAKEKGLCYRCLQKGHRGPQCGLTRKCGVEGCIKVHHPSLHGSNPPSAKAEQNRAINAYGIGSDGKIQLAKVALRVLPVYVADSKGNKRKIYAFLDDGSDSSYLRTDVAKALGLAVERNDLTLATLVNKHMVVPSGLVSLTVSSLDGCVSADIGVRTLKNMCEGLSAPNWHSLKEKWTHLQGVNFPKVAGRKRIDLLIGSDHPELTLSLEERIGSPGDPVARRTPLGWTCVGALDPQQTTATSYFVSTCNSRQQESRLEDEIRRLWDMDVIHETTILPTPEEQKALKKASDSVTFNVVRYSVKIPWKGDKPELPDNKPSAVKRLETLVKVFSGNLKWQQNIKKQFRTT